MNKSRYLFPLRAFASLCVGIGLLFGDTPPTERKIHPALQPASAQSTQITHLFLPLISKRFPGIQPFGLESHSWFTNNSILQSAVDSEVGWARMGIRVSWRNLQPDEGGAIRWSLLSTFEDELRLLKQARIAPVLIVYDSPHWAVMNARNDGVLSSCAAIATEKFDDFASFLSQLAERYSTPEFGVRDWEIGNEIDIDPDLVPPDNGFGCWGDLDDLYYGGQQYGQMLKVITPAIRAKSPGARIWIGGLLLDRPSTPPAPGVIGRSELFMEGVLLAGAAPYFDVLPYHFYPSYFQYVPCTFCDPVRIDYDYYASGSWKSVGGGVKGKAEYLQNLLAKYHVNKPLSLNETALGCMVEYFSGCDPSPAEEFLQAQADYAVRTGLRALGAGVSSYSWFTLNDPGWRDIGLLDINKKPKPVYYAYQEMINQHHQGQFKGSVVYGDGIEAYAIQREQVLVHAIWTFEDEVRVIRIPASRLIAIYSRDGESLPLPEPVNGYYHLQVTFSPIYFHLVP